MQKSKNEFLEVVSTLYIVILLVVLPLYNQGSYWKLGDVKYMLFRNTSIVCLGVALGVIVSVAVVGIFTRQITWGCSPMDMCMMTYGVCVLISALGSAYPRTAWLGYGDWYMGALSQLMFVGIYFLLSEYYVAKGWVIYLAEATLAAVIMIGLLNRLEFDPLRMFAGIEAVDWEYSHMLSTIGNINWLCGYLSVMLAFPMAGYLYSKTKLKCILLYLCSVFGLTLLCIQGSTMGPVIAVGAVGICLIAGLWKAVFFQRGLLLALGVSVLIPIMGALIVLLGAQAATPIDGDVLSVMLWKGWWVIILALGASCLISVKLQIRAQKYVACTMIGLGVLSVAVVGSYILWKLLETDGASWGSGRGGLWRAALTGFINGDWRQKLWGAGPDCFAEYIYRMPEAASLIRMEGHWKNATFANAHNEWLNQLVNTGVFGTLAYLSIFLCGLKRYRGMFLGLLALGMYGICSLVGFQQVLSTPLLFVVLGICENRYRKAESAKHLTDSA